MSTPSASPVLMIQSDDANEPDLRRVLQQAGFTVWVQSSLDAAVTLPSSFFPRFIVVDIPILKDDILKLAQAAKARFPSSILVGKLPSNHLYGRDPDALAFFKELGFHHILLKPLHQDTLLATLEFNL